LHLNCHAIDDRGALHAVHHQLAAARVIDLQVEPMPFPVCRSHGLIYTYRSVIRQEIYQLLWMTGFAGRKLHSSRIGER
jgi:hypothetical protein